MKLTANRKLILKILDDHICGDLPPHSVSGMMYLFTNIEESKKYYQIEKFPSRKQVERTLRDLWANGYIIANRVYADWDQGLPYWERRYQLSTGVEKNYIITASEKLYRKAHNAKYGLILFGGNPFDYGLLPDEVIQLKE